MAIVSQEAIKQLQGLMDEVMAVEEPLKKTFQNVHQGYLAETLLRFLKAREGNVAKAHIMKPIVPTELYRAVRDSQLIGMSGYSREGFPVFAYGIGLSTYDKASVHYYVQSHIQINEYRDRVILKMYEGTAYPYMFCVCSLQHLKKWAAYYHWCEGSGHDWPKAFSTESEKVIDSYIDSDDLNYPEKTKHILHSKCPICIFSLLEENGRPFGLSSLFYRRGQRKKVQVLYGCGQDELLKIEMQCLELDISLLLKLPTVYVGFMGLVARLYEAYLAIGIEAFEAIMDYASLPHFCRKEGSGSSRHVENCFSLDHPFHQQLYNYIKEQSLIRERVEPIKHRSFHVDLPEPAAEGTEIVKTIESEFHKIGNGNGIPDSVDGLNGGLPTSREIMHLDPESHLRENNFVYEQLRVLVLQDQQLTSDIPGAIKDSIFFVFCSTKVKDEEVGTNLLEDKLLN
ncbi:hypothetical protein CJ030_MR2G024035 [Morella rubra]|uniref:CRAL-TRIO domain-containing protein n=1 Tax=Morella rubra TaxID=262757 RepID=A0A6A1WBF0_9ROSI|nr:hypothetical protein CJ030_MR2G024035 [Morella rubra]